ncbi:MULTISPECIES: CDP-alcohol phosphatidyltransferase family protein [Frigoribacterium]|uniref:CDP-alcohol phosphatidyltransferase family protein n=1 Tax=Frigoribacterium TaxID=96492 RepID=UPI000F4AC3C2|nr:MULTISPECIES: CDP-alcohol phosphatidyltransferase family protein [Frigoribacterium]NQW87112.1 CDP-alcohol phosphatidyltransferase family protein [Frigoribacterium sp. VKM Ac-2860]NQX08443.1 CDP-alcohol phosphatidyltransferase family protein [Frigoribacterium sp. VKM Ac-2859]ROS48350.1 cardiolipin synthase [Frigoribacterium sp. PhB118]WAC51639.1 CDP-alcohol phosphatidyltransferase family protein [Frigoribacterium sp. SL97]
MTLVDKLFRQDEWRTVPNAISAARLLLLPVFLVLIVGQHYWSAMVVIAVVFVTDFLDGFIARRTNTTSELGRWLDPVADRITVIVVVIAFVAGGLVPWPVLPLLLVPDLLLSAYALFVLAGASFPVTWVGKIRTALIFVGLLLVLVAAAVVDQFGGSGGASSAPLADAGAVARTIGLVVLWAGLVGHWVAAVLYAAALVRTRRARRTA